MMKNKILMMKNKKQILGGPEKKSFFKDKVVPANFSKSDPFWDFGETFKILEEDIRKGNIEDYIVIVKHKDLGIKSLWRGVHPLSTALGMLSYCQIDLFDKNV